jgi:hypothetical protein
VTARSGSGEVRDREAFALLILKFPSDLVPLTFSEQNCVFLVIQFFVPYPNQPSRCNYVKLYYAMITNHGTSHGVVCPFQHVPRQTEKNRENMPGYRASWPRFKAVPLEYRRNELRVCILVCSMYVR